MARGPSPRSRALEMNPREEPSQQVSDRRRHHRRGSSGRVRLTVEPVSIAGEVENVSRSGLLFVGEGNLRVSVEIDENGTKSKRTGRIVRAQRLRGQAFGWAIEFDA